jgi:hypothetical protein
MLSLVTEPEQDLSTILGRIAAGRSSGRGQRGRRTPRDWSGLMRQLGLALAASGRRAGVAAVTSGRWLADVVVDAAPRIPVRDLETLRLHHPGLDREQLADAIVASAVKATMAVGIAGGAVTGIQWTVPVTLIAIPVELAVEISAVAAIEIKLVAELHEIYGVPVHGSGTQRGAAYALSWANRRGVNPLEPATMTAALGVVARRRVQRRILVKAGRGIGTLAPLMAGAAYGAYSNRRQTLLLADSLRGDLRRRPLMTGLTGNAVSRLLEPGVRRLVGRPADRAVDRSADRAADRPAERPTRRGLRRARPPGAP